jgi:CheY-like chemotaxis protein
MQDIGWGLIADWSLAAFDATPLLEFFALGEATRTMDRKPVILCIGHDPVLNRTRRLVLEKCFEVQLAESLTEARARLTEERFDVVLLCYSLNDEESHGAIELIDQRPGNAQARPRVLALAEGRRRLKLALGDEEVFPDGPAELLSKAAAMAGMSAAEARRCAPDIIRP